MFSICESDILKPMDVKKATIEHVDFHTLLESFPERSWLAIFFLNDNMLVSHFPPIDV